MQEGDRIPHLRPIHAGLKSKPASNTQLTALADHLVDTINTLDKICGDRLLAQTGDAPGKQIESAS